MSIRAFLKTLILIYSEAIWLFFGLTLYAKIQWDIAELPLPYGWILACLIGYVSHYYLFKSGTNHRLKYLLTLGLLVTLIILHWQWFIIFDLGYRLTLILASVFLFLRSAYYSSKEPTRAQMLLRFEGNVLWYILFVLIIKVHPSLETIIHVPFMVGIIVSLAGMTLTLEPDATEKEGIKTKMVGNYWGILGVIIVLIALGSLVTLLLLVSQVRLGLVSILSGTWEGVGALGNLVLKALTWLFSLTSPPVVSSELLQQPVSQALTVTEAEAVAYMKVPMFWIFMLIAVIAILAVLYLLPRMLPKLVSNHKDDIEIVSQNGGQSYWLWLWQRLKSLWKESILHWRRDSPSFYLFQVYWNFHLLQKWGRNKGIYRKSHETPLDYGQRIRNQLPENFNYQGLEYDLRKSVIDLAKCYGLAYYGGGRVVDKSDFEPLMTYIKL